MTIAEQRDGFSEHLQQVLQKSRVTYSSTNQVVLQGAHTKFSINDVPSPSVVVNLDKVGHLGALKKERRRLTSICDYLLIIAKDAHVDVTFVEMKETLREFEKSREQLVRTIPILKYLLSVCEIEFGTIFKVVQRFVVLASKREERIDKHRTKIKSRYLRSKTRHKGFDICIAIGGTVSFKSLDSTA